MISVMQLFTKLSGSFYKNIRENKKAQLSTKESWAFEMMLPRMKAVEALFSCFIRISRISNYGRILAALFELSEPFF